MHFSFIIPVLNEARLLPGRLAALQSLRHQGHELILVDGGSLDASRAVAEPLVDLLLSSPAGRARQMNLGASHARGDVLVFLHADTQLPQDAASILTAAIQKTGRRWGWFQVQMDKPDALFRLIAWSMNLRSRLTGVSTGDQCQFVQRALFVEIGGFPELALMEDVAMSKKLRRASKPLVIASAVITSARRWESKGVLRTIVFMWRLRLLYFLGVSTDKLARRYYPEH